MLWIYTRKPTNCKIHIPCCIIIGIELHGSVQLFAIVLDAVHLRPCSRQKPSQMNNNEYIGYCTIGINHYTIIPQMIGKVIIIFLCYSIVVASINQNLFKNAFFVNLIAHIVFMKPLWQICRHKISYARNIALMID